MPNQYRTFRIRSYVMISIWYMAQWDTLSKPCIMSKVNSEFTRSAPTWYNWWISTRNIIQIHINMTHCPTNIVYSEKDRMYVVACQIIANEEYQYDSIFRNRSYVVACHIEANDEYQYDIWFNGWQCSNHVLWAKSMRNPHEVHPHDIINEYK